MRRVELVLVSSGTRDISLLMTVSVRAVNVPSVCVLVGRLGVTVVSMSLNAQVMVSGKSRVRVAVAV